MANTPSPGRGRARSARSRARTSAVYRRRRLLVGGVVVLVVAATVITSLRLGTDSAGASHAAGVGAGPAATAPPRVLPTTIDPGWLGGCKGAFSRVEKGADGGPLSGQRVLWAGDSLTANSAAADEAMLARSGASYLLDAMPGSSPVDGSSAYDCMLWQQTFPDLVRQFQPTTVVLEFCCNYWWDAQDAHGNPIKSGTEAFVRLWESSLRALINEARAAGASVDLVVTPPSTQAAMGGLITQTNEAVLRLVADGTLSTSHLIRWDLALTGGSGVFTPTLDGHVVRQADGLHIAAPYGAALVAQATKAVLERHAAAPAN